VGFGVGLAGVAVLFATDLRALGEEHLLRGAVLLLSPISATVGQTIIKRNGARFSATLLNRNGMLVGAIVLWVPALVLEDPLAIAWTLRGVLSVAYLSLFGTVLTFGLYYWLLRFAPSNRLSLVSYVNPAIALWLGAAVGGEPIAATTLGGSALILTGIWLALRR
jgi:drug/metabolite transporter (DMT)-like permease